MTDHQTALLEAWSTLGAAVLAAVAAFFAYRAYVKESRIEKRLLDSDARAQASLVAAWIGDDPEPDPRARTHGVFVIVRNASEIPVFNVTWWIQLSESQVPGETEKSVPPSPVGLRYDPPMVLHDEYGWDNADLLDVTVGLTFTDASGVNWRRDSDGRLHQVGPDSS